MFQRLVDFQHLCQALCHFIIKFIFGEPGKERKCRLRTALPGTHSPLSSQKRDPSPGVCSLCSSSLAENPANSQAPSQPLSPTDNKQRFISSATLHPSSYFLALPLRGEPILPPHPCWALRSLRRRAHRKRGASACFSGLQPLRSLEHHGQCVTKVSQMKT